MSADPTSPAAGLPPAPRAAGPSSEVLAAGPGAPAADLLARDARCVWHPYTQHATEAALLPVASARDAVLRLTDGRELIDAISSWWTCLHGHARPELLAAMSSQAATLDHVLFAGATHEPAVALAEALLAVVPGGIRGSGTESAADAPRRAGAARPSDAAPDAAATRGAAAPPPLTRVFYSDDGSTAVEVALKLCYQSWALRGEPRRTVFIALQGAYHGDTFGAMAVGDPDPFFTAFAPLLFAVRRAEPTAAGVAAALAELGDRAAGLIVEPLVQGAGGMAMHAESELRGMRAACDAAGVPLIADEVMTGFGRSGALFACGRAGIVPDVLCLAKGLTGGLLPLAATLTTEHLFSAFLARERSRAFFHGHSFTAHPIACAVALASLRLCLAEDTPGRLDRLGRKIELALRARLRTDPRGAAAVADVRRCGGIVALTLAASGPPAANDHDPAAGSGAAPAGYLSDLGPRLRAEAVARGVLLRPLGDVLYAMPPACTIEAQAERIGAVMAELALLARG